MTKEPALREVCGIVMPISNIDGCSEEHWRDVKQIISEAIEEAGFSPQLVSEADDVGIIQKRIIQNLYENPIVVVDVSAKNPNVMFELGLRLAFDKPTVIIKDDKTSYSFDTSPVEHLSYPRDLRFGQIVDFKDALADKVRATAQKAATDPSYTTFLKHFGTFKVAQLSTEVVSTDRLIMEEIRDLREMFLRSTSGQRSANAGSLQAKTLCLLHVPEKLAKLVSKELSDAGHSVQHLNPTNGHVHFRFAPCSTEDRAGALAIAKGHVPEARWLGGGSAKTVET